jgi:GPH family glycoside/pentoside/hexuronide:cation symporter
MLAKRLSLGTKLGFGVCDLGGNLFFTIMGFYLLNFMTDVAKLGAGLAGIAMMIGKVCDAITDPTVGYLSDRTKSRWGRRRPWMFWGAIFLFLCDALRDHS